VIRVRLAAAAVGALVVGVANAATVTANPRLMVLRLNDLPTGFAANGGHYVSNVRAARESKGTASVADFLRWGRISGYDTSFTRTALVGLIQLDSNASTYKSTRGAADSLRASFRAIAQSSKSGYRFKRLSIGTTIGHESRLYTARMKAAGTTIDLYAVAWRYFTVKASTTGGGVAGTVTPETIVALAKKQQRHIQAALR
jgi:hypothetical protein